MVCRRMFKTQGQFVAPQFWYIVIITCNILETMGMQVTYCDISWLLVFDRAAMCPQCHRGAVEPSFFFHDRNFRCSCENSDGVVVKGRTELLLHELLLLSSSR